MQTFSWTRHLALLVITVLFIQCEPPTIESPTNQVALFDLKSFFDDEIKRLNSLKLSYQKEVIFNKKSETQIITSPDLKSEFASFYASEINKSTWRDHYKITQNGNTTAYTTLEKALKIKSLSIDNSSQGITIIQIKKEDSNLLNQSQEQLYYHSNNGYKIKHIRHSLGGKPDTLIVNFKFTTTQ